MSKEIQDYQRGWNDAMIGRAPGLNWDGGERTESAEYWEGVADASVLIDSHYRRGWRDAVAAVRKTLVKRFGKGQAS